MKTTNLFTCKNMLLGILILCSPLWLNAEKVPIFNVQKKEGQVVEYQTDNGKIAHYMGFSDVSQKYLGEEDGFTVYDVKCTKPGYERCSARHNGRRYYFSVSPFPGGTPLRFYHENFKKEFNDLMDMSELDFFDGKLSGMRSIKVNAFSIEGEQCCLEFSIVWNFNEKGDGEMQIFADALQ